MSWKHDVGGWVTNTRGSEGTSTTLRRTARGTTTTTVGGAQGTLEHAMSNVTARSSPPLTSTRPKSPLLNRSSPSRTPNTEASSRASPSSLAGTARGSRGNAPTAAQPTAASSFVPKGWAAAGAAPRPSAVSQRVAKVVFADRLDDKLPIADAPNPTAEGEKYCSLTLPTLLARSRNSSQRAGSSGVVAAVDASVAFTATAATDASTTRSRWVTLFGGTPGDFHHALHHLSSVCGPIRRVHWPATSANCNWLHVQFMDTLAAAAAADKGEMSISLPCIGMAEARTNAYGGRSAVFSARSSVGDVLSFGIRWCDDVALMQHYRDEDMEQERANALWYEHATGRGRSEESAVGADVGTPAPSDDAHEDRPLTALDRIAKLSAASQQFHRIDASSAMLNSSTVGNRNYHGSFSATALGGGSSRLYHASSSGMYLSTQAPTRAEARNSSVYVPVATMPNLRTAAEVWGPADVPLAPRILDGILTAVSAPLAFGIGLWRSRIYIDGNGAGGPSSSSSSYGGSSGHITSSATGVVTTSGHAAYHDDEYGGGFSIFSLFGWGGLSYDAPADRPRASSATTAGEGSTAHKGASRKRVTLHRKMVTTTYEPVTNDVRVIIRPLPFYLDYGRIVSLLLVLLLAFAAYYFVLSPVVDAIVDALMGILSFIFGTLGLALGGGGSGGSAARRGAGGRMGGAARAAAPQWEYLYEANFDGTANNNGYVSF